MLKLNLLPFLSEKSNFNLKNDNRYTFIVNYKLNKIEIVNQIQKLFNVKVLNIRSMIYSPNVKKKNTKQGIKIGKTNKFKKIIFDLEKDQKIDIYSKI